MLRSCARVISRSATAQLPTRMGPTNLHTSICNNRTFTTTTTYRSPAASSSSPASSSSSSSPPGKVSAFGGTRRVDSAAFAGPIAPAADAAKSEERLALAKKRHAPILNPIHVSRGSSHRSARMHRELHAPNLKDLNHSLAHYIQRSHTWNDLVALCFDHMHHMTHHNLLRAMQKLGAFNTRTPRFHARMLITRELTHPSYSPICDRSSSIFSAPSIQLNFPPLVKSWITSITTSSASSWYKLKLGTYR